MIEHVVVSGALVLAWVVLGAAPAFAQRTPAHATDEATNLCQQHPQECPTPTATATATPTNTLTPPPTPPPVPDTPTPTPTPLPLCAVLGDDGEPLLDGDQPVMAVCPTPEPVDAEPTVEPTATPSPTNTPVPPPPTIIYVAGPAPAAQMVVVTQVVVITATAPATATSTPQPTSTSTSTLTPTATRTATPTQTPLPSSTPTITVAVLPREDADMLPPSILAVAPAVPRPQPLMATYPVHDVVPSRGAPRHPWYCTCMTCNEEGQRRPFLNPWRLGP